jgi:AcrR family transcriptional regulator
MKTIKQIADELGVSKQRVYRCVKNACIAESLRKRDTMYYDEAAETLIKSYFAPILDHISEAPPPQKTVLNEADNALHETVNSELVEWLRAELEAKNRQIDELTASLREQAAAFAAAQETIQAAQALHGGTMKQTLIEEKAEQRDRGFFARIFGKHKE